VGTSSSDSWRPPGEPKASRPLVTHVQSNVVEAYTPGRESIQSTRPGTSYRRPSVTSGEVRNQAPSPVKMELSSSMAGMQRTGAAQGVRGPYPSFSLNPLPTTPPSIAVPSRKVGTSADIPVGSGSPSVQSRAPSRPAPEVSVLHSPVLPHRAVPAAIPLKDTSIQKASRAPKSVCRPVSTVQSTAPVPMRTSKNPREPESPPVMASPTLQAKEKSRPRAQDTSQDNSLLRGPHVTPSVQPRCAGDMECEDVPSPHDESQQFFDVAIPESLHKALLDMGTSTGANSVLEFITEAQASSSTREVDGSMWRYWEKRRVQNALRRILENLQDCFGCDDLQLIENLPMVFDEIMKNARALRCSDCRIDINAGTIDERGFFLVLESMGAMPRELYEADKSETFTAMIIPTAAVARSAIQTGCMPGAVLTKDAFQKGLSQVPFNLPDFPVPTYLLKEQPRRFQVMKEIAKTFSERGKGLEVIKDFLLTTIMSVEEIQAVLPRLIAFSAVEDAVIRIIRAASRQSTMKDWRFFVKSRQEFDLIRHAENQAAMGCDMSVEQPESDYPDFPPDFSPDLPSDFAGKETVPESVEPPSDEKHVVPESPDIMPREVTLDIPSTIEKEQAPPVPQTEPLPNREVRPEPSQNTSKTPGPGFRQLQRPMVVDWNSVLRTAGAGHALMKLATGGDDAAGPSKGGENNKQPDLVMILSLEQHAEGRGPFLAAPFARCCEICCNIFRSAGEPM